MNEQCQAQQVRGGGRNRVTTACSREAAWLYTNGDYRRRECDMHAAITRSFIRPSDDPRDPRLLRIGAADPAPPG